MKFKKSSDLCLNINLEIFMEQTALQYLKNADQLILEKKYDLAEYYFLKSLEHDQTEEQFLLTGKFYTVYLNKQEEAERMFRCALTVNSDSGAAMEQLAEIFYKKGDLHSAHQYFNQVIQVESAEKYRALYYLANLYVTWNRPERSLRYLHLCLKLKSDFIPAIKLQNKLKNKYLPQTGRTAV